MMHLKVLFDPESGRIFGAQACGFDGIDKRLDLLAMAVRQGMTVSRPEHQEPAYAPPFGSAKDPINMAGFVASNVLREICASGTPRTSLPATEGALLVDDAHARGVRPVAYPGAVNIPLATLRDVITAGDLDPARPVRVYCAVGFRSYLAYRILVQRVSPMSRRCRVDPPPSGGTREARGHLRGAAGRVLRRGRHGANRSRPRERAR